ncbi:MAG: hypothetical protein VKJ09_15745, partial [Leptolyngbya sp.]|nr:hypothetical protein [Leptolyngbya sp.]
GNFSMVYEADCSYAYECGDAVPSSAAWADPGNKSGQNLSGKSMGHLKRVQRQFGNMDANGNYGAPFSDDYIPFVRCWHHHDWSQSDANLERVQNAAWSTRVYWSKPFWENTANPDIPVPNN